jgi:hypothetical protein
MRAQILLRPRPGRHGRGLNRPSMRAGVGWPLGVFPSDLSPVCAATTTDNHAGVARAVGRETSDVAHPPATQRVSSHPALQGESSSYGLGNVAKLIRASFLPIAVPSNRPHRAVFRLISFRGVAALRGYGSTSKSHATACPSRVNLLFRPAEQWPFWAIEDVLGTHHLASAPACACVLCRSYASLYAAHLLEYPAASSGRLSRRSRGSSLFASIYNASASRSPRRATRSSVCCSAP